MNYIVAGLLILIFAATAKTAFASTSQTPTKQTIPYENLFDSYTAIHGVSKRLMVSIVKKESSFNPKAFNPESAADKRKGRNVDSVGLAQILYPDTAKAFRPDISIDELFVPEVNLKIAYELMSGLLRAHPRKDSDGFNSYAVAAYNAGSPRFLSNGTFVNQSYVDGVKTNWKGYSYV